MFALGVGENFTEGLRWNAVVFLMELRGRAIYARTAKKLLRSWASRMSTDSETFVNVRLRLRGPKWTARARKEMLNMGWAAKNNPVAQAARQGEIPPKKPPLGKKAVRRIMAARMEELIFPPKVREMLAIMSGDENPYRHKL